MTRGNNTIEFQDDYMKQLNEGEGGNPLPRVGEWKSRSARREGRLSSVTM